MTPKSEHEKSIHDECGIFGIVNHPEAANITYLGLHGLQHRGQESAGIVSASGRKLYAYRRLGLVGDIFTPDVLGRLHGDRAIGHVRYSTAGASSLSNAQPLTVHYSRGSLAVAHNGNLTNALVLREELEEQGAIFQSTSDTEVLVHMIARSKGQEVDDVCSALFRARGSYSILFMSGTYTIAARDPFGIRPLCMGRLGNGWVIASESAAFDLIGADFVRDIDPGEVVVFETNAQPVSLKPFPRRKCAMCLFEYVYFARPDSILDGTSVYMARKRMGRILAKEHPVDADVIVPVPDSGTAAALGFSEESGIPFEQGFIRSHYIGRTFIEPKQSIRNFGVKLKLNPSRAVLGGKRVVVIDDSIVRGTTSRKIVENIRRVGAVEVHFRVSSPPIKYSCKYGIDTPTDSELIAHSMDIESIREHLGVDSLGYLSLPGLIQSAGREGGCCSACFDGCYPIEFEDKGRKLQLRFEGL